MVDWSRYVDLWGEESPRRSEYISRVCPMHRSSVHISIAGGKHRSFRHAVRVSGSCVFVCGFSGNMRTRHLGDERGVLNAGGGGVLTNRAFCRGDERLLLIEIHPKAPDRCCNECIWR